MARWIIRSPHTHSDGKDYRPGDTLDSDVPPNCEADLVEESTVKESVEVQKPIRPKASK